MIVKEDFLKKLRAAFDLNEYEVKIWTALLSRGVASAGELAEISNVPRSRSYDVLETLEKKGFIIMKLGKPIKYMAVKPEEILHRVKNNVQKRAQEQVKSLEEVRSTELYRELQLLHDHGITKVDASSLSGALRGRNRIYDQLESMLRDAQKSVTLVTTGKGIIRKYDILKPILKKAKNIKVRILTNVNKDNKEMVDELRKYAEVKNVDKVNARYCIVDGKELLFMMMEDDKVHESYDTAVWVDTQYFAGALENLFNLTWNSLRG